MGPTATGKYFKQTNWTKASENALIVESVHSNLGVPGVLGSGWPYQPDTATPMVPEPDPSGAVNLTLDFNRHSKTPLGTKPNVPSLNVLYCDGHADTASARTAAVSCADWRSRGPDAARASVR